MAQVSWKNEIATSWNSATESARSRPWWSSLTALLEPLASLRLTVGLLILAVFIVWVASMQQTAIDIWTVKSQHFRSLWVFIEYKTFFPPAWFPALQGLTGGCFLPSGLAVLLAMMANLIAAHCVRMRVQARGARLGAGLAVAAAGMAVTWLVIFGAQNPSGFQVDYSSEFYRNLWWVIQWSMLGIGFAAAWGAQRMERQQILERVFLWAFAGTMWAGLGLLWWLGDRAFIGDSAMRILWQLIQGTIAASVMMVAAVLLFKRKGAVVLIHLGILMLMGNEVYVSLTNVEQQMFLIEGDSASHAVDSRYQEMFVADTSDPASVQITTIPAEKLQSTQDVVHPDLPFLIRPLSFFGNSELVRRGEKTAPLSANRGVGLFYDAQPLPPTAAVGSERAQDKAAAYVEFLDKTTRETLGVYLLSQTAHDGAVLDSVEVAGKSYQVGLRYRTYLKPYQIHLVNAESVNYEGTTIPKSYSSDFLLSDQSRGLQDNPQRVWMNNPLRYGNETFYQTGYDRLPDGREYSVLQIVKNSGWMIPYVACMFVVLGLVVQFGNTLGNFISQRESQPTTVASPIERTVAWGLAIILLLSMGPFAISTLYRSWSPRTMTAGLNLDHLGSIPLLYQGRVQPLDTLARNTARQLGSRETVLEADGEKSVPAIRWLADVIFRAPGWEKYRLFRITDLGLLNELGLTPGSPFKYSLDDLSQVPPTGTKTRYEILDQLVTEARKLDVEKLSVSQKRLIDLHQKVTLVQNLQFSFAAPLPSRNQEETIDWLIRASKLAKADELPRVPYALASAADKESELQWTTLANLQNRQRLVELQETLKAQNEQELTDKLVDNYFAGPLVQSLRQEQMIQLLTRDPEISQVLANHAQQPESQRNLMKALEQIPPERIREITAQADQLVQEQLQRDRPNFVQNIEGLIRPILESTAAGTPGQFPLALEGHYRESEAAEFNGLLADYLSSPVVQAAEATPLRVRAEGFYNRLSPFYVAMVLYLVALLVSMLGVVFAPRSLSPVASYLLWAGLAFHIGGIILRVVISGRPPVTSLYTSFIFVSAVCVAALACLEKVTKLNLCNLLAGLSGFGMLLWTWTMSIKDGDTFTVLVAVLDTQFWLSTHVICISLGYVATIVAGLIGAGTLVRGLILKLAGNPATKSELQFMANIVYGVTCFGLLFSFFGTVLGGLWADDSWGRFWGWDTKENGALMIVFWNAVLLHARWGGLIRATGIAAVSVLGVAVTFWSWQGVNLLGVGLHNYGFSEEGLIVMLTIVGASLLISAIGLIRLERPNPPLKST